MMFRRLILLTLFILLCYESAVASRRDSIRLQRDSVRRQRELAHIYRDSLRKRLALMENEPTDSLYEARNQILFDSLQSKAKRGKVSRLLYNLLVTDKPRIAQAPSGAVVDQSLVFQPYHGRRISSIEIERIPVFDTAGNWFERTGNNLHVQTRERVIRRDLLFEVGDTLDPQEVVRNMQLLNSRSYISEVAVRIQPDTLNPGEVVVQVLVQDKWTISVDGRWGGDGETMVSLFDDNIMGWGTRFNIETNFDRRDFSYGGNVLQYKIPNIGGSFYQAEIRGGREFRESTLELSAGKEFIRPTDYELGASFIRDKSVYDGSDPANIIYSRIKKTSAWGGYSHLIGPIRSSIYWVAHFCRTRFEERPEVAFAYNPAYHESDELLLSLGLYREKHYTTNMIYGYGSREYIGTGYQAQLVGGYHWGEYHNGGYFGAELKGGTFFSWGYFYLGTQLGTYIRPTDGAWFRSMGMVDLKWFSNLLPAGRFHLRQLAKLNYTQGWNRHAGNNETINFNDDYGIRVLGDVPGGINRCSLNTETVIFTPYQPWGFRVTLFGFADFGLLGKEANPFKNNFYSAIGLGVRIKNERLIFGAIQLQLGLAFGKEGLMSDRWFRLSSQRTLNEFRYRPTYPEPLTFE